MSNTAKDIESAKPDAHKAKSNVASDSDSRASSSDPKRGDVKLHEDSRDQQFAKSKQSGNIIEKKEPAQQSPPQETVRPAVDPNRATQHKPIQGKPLTGAAESKTTAPSSDSATKEHIIQATLVREQATPKVEDVKKTVDTSRATQYKPINEAASNGSKGSSASASKRSNPAKERRPDQLAAFLPYLVALLVLVVGAIVYLSSIDRRELATDSEELELAQSLLEEEDLALPDEGNLEFDSDTFAIDGEFGLGALDLEPLEGELVGEEEFSAELEELTDVEPQQETLEDIAASDDVVEAVLKGKALPERPTIALKEAPPAQTARQRNGIAQDTSRVAALQEALSAQPVERARLTQTKQYPPWDQAMAEQPELSPEHRARLAAMVPLIKEESAEVGLSPVLVASAVMAEEAVEQTTSEPGIGISRLSSQWAFLISVMLNREESTTEQIDQRVHDMQLSLAYLAHLRDLFEGDLEKALLAHRMGPVLLGQVLAGRAELPSFILSYMEIVNRYCEQWGCDPNPGLALTRRLARPLSQRSTIRTY